MRPPPSSRLLSVSGLLAVALAAATAGAESRLIELSVRGGRLPQDQRVLRVLQGDDLVLRWTSDERLTVHLHGYDVERELSPSEPVTMTLRVDATGRFPIEVHGLDAHRHQTLGHLEVHPR